MRLKALYTFFCLAALMFVAKPFIGFSLGNCENQPSESHSILAKSFTIRKPEDLIDAKSNASLIEFQLANPPEHISFIFSTLLVIVFPVVYLRNLTAGSSFLNNLRARLIPQYRPYLLTGKLNI